MAVCEPFLSCICHFVFSNEMRHFLSNALSFNLCISQDGRLLCSFFTMFLSPVLIVLVSEGEHELNYDFR